MKDILKTAIQKQANPKQFPKTYLLHNRVKSANCPKCGGKIETVKTSGRTTYICPNCQK
jgi:formamidopyrimidine-DNA glycosylase